MAGKCNCGWAQRAA